MSSNDKGEVNSFALRKVQSAQTSLWDLDQLRNEGLQNNFYPSIHCIPYMPSYGRGLHLIYMDLLS